MCANKTDIDDSCVVVNLHDQAIAISLYIKHNSIARQKVCAGVTFFNCFRSISRSLFGFFEPGFQSLF